MMICTAECTFRQTVNWVLTASSSPTKHSTDQIQLRRRRAHLLAKRSKFATITNDVKVAALSLPVNMIMFASNRIATHPQWQHQSGTAQEPNTKPILNCRSSPVRYFD